MRNVVKLYTLLFIAFWGISSSYSQSLGSTNLIQNPNFSDSLNHYTTSYFKYDTLSAPEGSWLITDNPKNNFNRYNALYDHTQDSVKFLFFINSAILFNQNPHILEQTVKHLRKNSNYIFSFWAAPNSDLNLPVLRLKINDKVLIDSLELTYEPANIWKEYTFALDNFSSDTFNFTLYSLSNMRYGNDLGIDDISLHKLCEDKFDFIDTLKKCKEDIIPYDTKLQGHPYNYKIIWDNSPHINADNPFVPIFNNTLPERFYFNVVDDDYGCSYRDSIFVDIYSKVPVTEITAGNNGLICPCESIKLSVPTGYKYLWNTGDTTNEITVNNAGKYSVLITNGDLCSTDLEISVNKFLPQIEISTDSISAKIGDKFEIPVRYRRLNDQANTICRYDSINITLQYKKSIILPDDLLKYKLYSNNDIEVLKIPIPTNKIDTVIGIKCKAMFGSYECSDLILKLVDSCQKLFDTKIINGKFCISDLCTTPSVRLIEIDTSQQGKVKFYQSGKEIKAQYRFSDNTSVEIQLYDNLGKHIQSVRINNSKEGEITINTIPLYTGIYFYNYIYKDKVVFGKFIFIKN